MRAALVVTLLAACGDNRHVLAEDSLPPPAVRCTPMRGGTVVAKRIVFACVDPAAPPRPGCADGAVTLVTAPRQDPRLFALELHGRIRLVIDNVLQPEPFLDLSEDVGGPVLALPSTELGLLGLAFHPDYAQNRQFFVYYTARNPDALDTDHPYLDVVARYSTGADPNHADASSGVEVLAIPDPFANHNGGMIEFGRDGYLYISTGDGGGVSAAMNGEGNPQDPDSRLGKMLRIDVDHKLPGKEYGVPADNPFAGGGGAPEVFMLGLRNPWRWSFDRATGDMWIADVGAATYEELDFIPHGQQAGKNLGWPMYEAMSCYKPPCDPTGITFPIDVHDHAEGWWAIIGGDVYRGSCFPDLVGTYFFTDCGFGHMMTARRHSDGTFDVEQLPGDFVGGPASLHADGFGELYETDIWGSIWWIAEDPP
jgi:glucose/arabinose dehydrogenase